MLYKLAASKAKADERARKNVDAGTLGTVLAGPLGNSVAGYVKGDKVHHPIVGIFGGPAAVNGAVAKDTGHSTFGTTVGRGARNDAILGGLGGTLIGGAVHGLPGALSGGILGAAGGAVGGGLGHAMGYGMGHVFGEERPRRTKRRKRR